MHEWSMSGAVIYISEFQNNWPGNSAYLYQALIAIHTWLVLDQVATVCCFNILNLFTFHTWLSDTASHALMLLTYG